MLHCMRSFGGMGTLTRKSSDRNSRPSNEREIVKNSQWLTTTDSLVGSSRGFRISSCKNIAFLDGQMNT